MAQNKENYVPRHAKDKNQKVDDNLKFNPLMTSVWLLLSGPVVSLFIAKLIVSNTVLGNAVFVVLMLVILFMLLFC